MTETDGKLRARPCTRYRRRPVRRPVRGTPVSAWNIAVRTRGVFTHRDDFLGPACVEKGLVRPGISPISNSRCELVLAILLPPGQPPSPTAASASSALARCEPNLAKPLSPVRASCLATASASSARARCEPNRAKPLLPVRASCPATASAPSALAGCEPISGNPLLSGMPCRPDSLPTVTGQGNGVSVPLSDEPEASEDHLRFDASLQCLIERMSS